MIHRFGDMFKAKPITHTYRVYADAGSGRYVGNRPKDEMDPSWTIFTGNSYVNKKGELVMGRGAALAAKKLYPDLPAYFGKEILGHCGHLGRYDLLTNSKHRIGVLQVKLHYGSPAGLDIIKQSLDDLYYWASDEQHTAFHLNYPGIGNGKLAIGEVKPLVETLPDNIFVWRLTT